MRDAARGHGIQHNRATSGGHFEAQGLLQRGTRMRDDVVWKIFECCAFAQLNYSFENRGPIESSINARGRRCRQANVRFRLLDNFSNQVVAAQHAARRIEQHQVRCSIVERQWSQHLQGQREPRFA